VGQDLRVTIPGCSRFVAVDHGAANDLTITSWPPSPITRGSERTPGGPGSRQDARNEAGQPDPAGVVNRMRAAPRAQATQLAANVLSSSRPVCKRRVRGLAYARDICILQP
jgi:hypothetical protein